MNEDTMRQSPAGGYKWVVLILFSLATFMVSFCQFQPAFFAQGIMAQMHIDTAAFAIVTSAPMISSIIGAFFGGSLADRFGIKKVILVGFAISTVGALGRYFSEDFASLVVMSMLMGVAASFSTANAAKIAIAWFPPRQIGLVVGMSLALGVFGIAAAQAFTGIMFADYQSAFLASGIAMAVCMVLWAIFGKDRQAAPGQAVQAVSLRAGIAEVARSRHVWIAGVGAMLFTGFNVTFSGFVTTALIVYWGADPVTAGLIASAATIGAALGALFVPATVSRMRRAKAVCIAMPLVSAALVLVGWSIDSIVLRCICFPVAGLLYGSFNPLFMLYPSVLPEIRPQVSGTAGGIITTVMMSGSIIVPSLIVTPIAGDNYWLIVVIACIVLACASVCFALLPGVNGQSVSSSPDSASQTPQM